MTRNAALNDAYKKAQDRLAGGESDPEAQAETQKAPAEQAAEQAAPPAGKAAAESGPATESNQETQGVLDGEPPATESAPSAQKHRLSDGRELELDDKAASEYLEAGLLVGNIEKAKTILALDEDTKTTPELGEVIKAAWTLAKTNPERLRSFLEGLGGAAAQAGNQNGRPATAQAAAEDDPVRAELAALRQEIASLRQGQNGHAEQSEEEKVYGQIDSRAARFPTLKGMDSETLRSAVIGEMQRTRLGLDHALSQIALRTTQHSVKGAEETHKRGEKARNLTGVGKTGGAGMTSLSKPPQHKGEDLGNRKVLKAVMERYGW